LTKYFIPIFLSLLLGTIIVFIAPGNFQRAANTTSGIKIDLFLMIKSFFIVSYKYLIMSKWFVVGGLITALSFNFNYFNTAINPLKLIKTGAIFILSAFASVAPFSVLPEAATKHTSVHFQLLFYIGLCLIFYSFLKKIKIKYHLYNVVIYFFILYFIVIGSHQYIMGKEVKLQLNEREKLLKMNYGRKDTMYIDKIIVSQEIFTNRYYEYSNTEPWGLECLSNYYQIKAIRLK
jgi:hypothetical protein